MAHWKIRADHEGQLGLALTGRKGFEGPAEAKGLLSVAYLTRDLRFKKTAPANELVSRVREIGETLRREGPAYLHPSAQGLLLATPADCLEVIEKAVNWEAEKLYGVEGLGPFDEFEGGGEEGLSWDALAYLAGKEWRMRYTTKVC